MLNDFGIKGTKYLDGDSRNVLGGELLGINKLDDGQFQAKILLDNPNSWRMGKKTNKKSNL